MGRNVYLAGPMSGYDQYNFPAFFQAQEALETIGYTVYNPAEEDEKWKSDIISSGDLSEQDIKTVIRHDISLILDRVDLLVFLDGWQNSKGAMVEFSLARFLGLDCYTIDLNNKPYGLTKIDGRLVLKETEKPGPMGGAV